jgi:hypothetical protein
MENTCDQNLVNSISNDQVSQLQFITSAVLKKASPILMSTSFSRGETAHSERDSDDQIIKHRVCKISSETQTVMYYDTEMKSETGITL